MIRFFIFFACFMGVYPASAEEVRYLGAEMRDPFLTMSQERPADEFVLAEQRIKLMNIEGVLLSTTNPRAIIAGKIYHIGSVLDTGKVSRIDKEGVTIMVSGKEIVLEQKIRKPSYVVSKAQ